jgi:hypothetical protein
VKKKNKNGGEKNQQEKTTTLSLSPRGFPFWAKKQSWSGSR